MTWRKCRKKTDALKPKDFPYTFYLMDAAQEKAFDDPIFATYRGPVYGNDCGRDFIVDPNQPKENFQPENMANLVYSSLTPLKVFSGGEKPMTPRTLCEGVAKVKFIPGEHCFLENIQIQLREKPMTPRTLCEGVAKVKFIPDEHCFLENIQIQLREIKGEECMTIIFYAGPEL